MTHEDIELLPIPSSALPETALREWQLIIARAVHDTPGSLTAVLIERGRWWRLERLLWHKPGSGFLCSASHDESEPLRVRVAAALAAAGKPVGYELAE